MPPLPQPGAIVVTQKQKAYSLFDQDPDGRVYSFGHVEIPARTLLKVVKVYRLLPTSLPSVVALLNDLQVLILASEVDIYCAPPSTEQNQ